jgi:ABC-type dipeptide/oligopeptide/nickel transport system ATPase subunit
MRRDVQMIFQDPYSSLNPRLTVGEAIREPLLVHRIVPRKEVEAEARRLMDLVQLPEDSLQRYPHQFSGGQRQRIGLHAHWRCGRSSSFAMKAFQRWM